MSSRRRGDGIIVLCVYTAAPTAAFGKISSSWQLFLVGRNTSIGETLCRRLATHQWALVTPDLSRDSIESTSFDSNLASFYAEAAVFPLDWTQLLLQQQEEIRAQHHPHCKCGREGAVCHSGRSVWITQALSVEPH